MTNAQRHQLESIDRDDAEIARYRVSSGARKLIGRRQGPGIELFDLPADGCGRHYRVEGALQDPEAIAALVSDYTAQAERLDACPMDRSGFSAALGATDEEQLLGLFIGQA